MSDALILVSYKGILSRDSKGAVAERPAKAATEKIAPSANYLEQKDRIHKVKVTFSFDTWKEGHIVPSTWEYSIVKPEPQETDTEKTAVTNNKEEP